MKGEGAGIKSAWKFTKWGGYQDIDGTSQMHGNIEFLKAHVSHHCQLDK